jgi:cell division protein FtsL
MFKGIKMKNKINKNLGNKNLLIYLALAVLILSIAGFIIALSPQEEISQLESEISNAGFG